MQGVIEPGLHPRSRLLQEALTDIGVNLGLHHAVEQSIMREIQTVIQRHEDIRETIAQLEHVQETLRAFADWAAEVDAPAASTGEPEPEGIADGDRGH